MRKKKSNKNTTKSTRRLLDSFREPFHISLECIKYNTKTGEMVKYVVSNGKWVKKT